MSFSNREVARRAVANHHKPVQGSNFRSTPTPDAPQVADIRCLQTIYSYYTEVARLVHNANTGRRELWLDSHRYSSSTDRQISYLRSAARDHADIDIYTFPLNHGTIKHRCTAITAADAVNRANSHIIEATRPRKHAQTRTRLLETADAVLTHAVHTSTHGINPVQLLNFPTTLEHVRQAQELRTAVAHWVSLPIEGMLAATKAYVALSHGE
jgi:hypothetical protein